MANEQEYEEFIMEEEIDLPVTTTAGAGIRVVSPAVNIDFQDQDPKPPTVKSNAEVLQEILTSLKRVEGRQIEMQIAMEYRMTNLEKKTDQLLAAVYNVPLMEEQDQVFDFPLRHVKDREKLVDRIQDNDVMTVLLVKHFKKDIKDRDKAFRNYFADNMISQYSKLGKDNKIKVMDCPVIVALQAAWTTDTFGTVAFEKFILRQLEQERARFRSRRKRVNDSLNGSA